MDLATIEKKPEDGKYQSAKECFTDFDQIFALCSKNQNISDAIKIKAESVETFFKAKLELLSEVEEEVDIKLRKAKEMSGLQDYTSSFFTPDYSKRSQRKTQQFDVIPFQLEWGREEEKE